MPSVAVNVSGAAACSCLRRLQNLCTSSAARHLSSSPAVLTRSGALSQRPCERSRRRSHVPCGRARYHGGGSIATNRRSTRLSVAGDRLAARILNAFSRPGPETSPPKNWGPDTPGLRGFVARVRQRRFATAKDTKRTTECAGHPATETSEQNVRVSFHAPARGPLAQSAFFVVITLRVMRAAASGYSRKQVAASVPH